MIRMFFGLLFLGLLDATTCKDYNPGAFTHTQNKIALRISHLSICKTKPLTCEILLAVAYKESAMGIFLVRENRYERSYGIFNINIKTAHHHYPELPPNRLKWLLIHDFDFSARIALLELSSWFDHYVALRVENNPVDTGNLLLNTLASYNGGSNPPRVSYDYAKDCLCMIVKSVDIGLKRGFYGSKK